MVRTQRLHQRLTVRSAIVVCGVAAVVGWAVVLGAIYAARMASDYLEARGGGERFNEITPASGSANRRP